MNFSYTSPGNPRDHFYQPFAGLVSYSLSKNYERFVDGMFKMLDFEIFDTKYGKCVQICIEDGNDKIVITTYSKVVVEQLSNISTRSLPKDFYVRQNVSKAGNKYFYLDIC